MFVYNLFLFYHFLVHRRDLRCELNVALVLKLLATNMRKGVTVLLHSFLHFTLVGCEGQPLVLAHFFVLKVPAADATDAP
jgi:hypothetical protein